MRDFQKIEWEKYNRPPFYQQWLCRDDTFKLATFGDRGLAEIDDQILALKDQWDLASVKGRFLDRIGKLLSEARNRNTDDRYRIMLNLRRLLNTNDGSIPSIIKAVKFFYSSEIVHIVPDYPAGLIIEHDGEGTPGLNFNKLLAEIIPAGISFSTKELFYFIDKLLSNDTYKTMVRYKTAESVPGQIYHNGRILRDGKTILPKEKLPYIRNGRNYHNGDTAHSGEYTAEANSYIKLPLLRESGILDPMHFGFGLDFKEFQFSRTYHNGNLNRMLTARHNGLSMSSLEDYLAPLSFHSDSVDELNLMESVAVNLNIFDSEDGFSHNYSRNNTVLRDGNAYRSSIVNDKNTFKIEIEPVSENQFALLAHNASVRRNGSEKHRSQRPAYDRLHAGMRHHRFHNGGYSRNNGIKHNAGVLIPLDIS